MSEEEEGGMERTSITMPPSMLKRLKQEAKAAGKQDLSSFIRRIIAGYWKAQDIFNGLTNEERADLLKKFRTRDLVVELFHRGVWEPDRKENGSE